MSDIHGGGGRDIERRSNAVGDHVAGILLENIPSQLPEDVKRRLFLDFGQNKTADYSRVNLTEVFAVFGCDAIQTANHWRIAKILDGWNFAARELKICKNITPEEVVKEVYKRLIDGKAEEDFLDVFVEDPDEPDGKPIPVKVSLATMAHLLDVIGTNRSLGVYKVDLRRVVYNYFTNKELKVKVGGLENNNEATVNLFDNNFSPKDNFADLDVKSYLNYIKKPHVQIGLQMMQGWVYTSDGHRELGGQAESVKDIDGSGRMFIPLSGRMASERTLTELQKSDKGGMNGQPQEVGDMDEDTGVVVRFRIADLEQRKKGGNVRNVGKTQRLAKAMTGLTSKENAADNIHAEVIGKEKKKAVYFCGHDLDGKIIDGIKNHYNKSMKVVRGFGLTDDEAADIALTDVFAPCIINNENDWLDALGQSFSMGKQGSTSLINNKDSFGEYVLKIKCRNWKKEGYPIEWMTFSGMTGDDGLRAYIAWRAGRGDIDQPGAARFADAETINDSAKGEAKYEEFIKNGIKDSNEANKFRMLLERLLGDEEAGLIDRYISDGGEAPVFENTIKDGNKIIKKEALSFSDYLSTRFAKKRDEADARVCEILSEIYDGIDIDWADTDEDADVLAIIEGFLVSLQRLSKSEREKIRRTK